MKIALQFTTSCARGRVPEVLIVLITHNYLNQYHRLRVHIRVPGDYSTRCVADVVVVAVDEIYMTFHGTNG